MKSKVKGLKEELEYCKEMVRKNHRSPHWSIRVVEITKELHKVKRKKK